MTPEEEYNALVREHPHLIRREEPSIAWVLKVVFTCMFVAAAVPTAAFFYLDSRSADQRIRANRNLIETVEQERIAVQERINDFIFNQCIDGEIRDTVMVQQYRADIQLARSQFPPSAALNNWVQSRRDAIFTLEPEDEPDCTPPPASG